MLIDRGLNAVPKNVTGGPKNEVLDMQCSWALRRRPGKSVQNVSPVFCRRILQIDSVDVVEGHVVVCTSRVACRGSIPRTRF